MQTQLELGVEDDLRIEVAKTKEQLTNLRRGLFGRYDKLVNELSAIQDKMYKIHKFLAMEDEREEEAALFTMNKEYENE